MSKDFLKFVKQKAIDKEGHAKGLNPSIKKFLKKKNVEFKPEKLKELMANPHRTKGLITYRNALNNFFEAEIFIAYEQQAKQEKKEEAISPPELPLSKAPAPIKEDEAEPKTKTALSLDVQLRKSSISFEENYRDAKNEAGTKLTWLIRMENESEGLVMEFSATEAQKERIRKGKKIKLTVEVS